MQELEKSLSETCKKYNDYENEILKGDLIYNSFLENQLGEELLAYYVVPKQKFDCLYGILFTNTRIIEVNSYSTMVSLSVKKYKQIKKIIFEKEFDAANIKAILSNESWPERVLLKITYIDIDDQEEEISWEKIENEENIIDVMTFVKLITKIQSQKN